MPAHENRVKNRFARIDLYPQTNPVTAVTFPQFRTLRKLTVRPKHMASSGRHRNLSNEEVFNWLLQDALKRAGSIEQLAEKINDDLANGGA